LRASAATSWGRSFCSSHHTGYFCSGVTQVRCCRQGLFFVKCGSVFHSRACGWGGGGGGGGWVIHQGWRQSSFCREHHVGFYCSNHRSVHCCNDHGHFVDCSTRTESSRWC
jgi:hypothetical protein